MTLQEFSDRNEALHKKLQLSKITQREYDRLKKELYGMWVGNISKLIGR